MNFTEAIVLAVEKVKAWIQSGGVKWDHVSDKPFVKVGGDTLTWDGNTEGLVSVDMGDGAFMYKVSDAVPVLSNFANGATVAMTDGVETNAISFSAEELMDMGHGVLTYQFGMALVPTEAVGADIEGLIFTEAGTYFIADGSTFVTSLTIPGYTGFAKEQIDPEYLPGAVVLYADAEDYLCSDSAMSKRVTRAELLNSMRSGRAMYVDLGEGTYLSVFGVQDLVEFAVVSVGMISDGVFAGGFFFYTAEYTA